MITIRCAGVPEHFNYPWQLALKSGDFERAGINVAWEDQSGGTGAMATDLRNNEIDLAIMLTEGALTDIVNGNPSKMVSTYVTSPLIWGVHTSSSSFANASNLENLPFAISRPNSGSHLMAYVYAKQKSLNLSEESFNLVKNLDGARHALKADPDQLFLWEKFTTKPLVDSGEFKMIDECPTPWPSFMVVVREAYLQAHMDIVDKVLKIVKTHATRLSRSPIAALQIGKAYHLQPDDAQAWFDDLQWQIDYKIDISMLQKVSSVLHELGIISKTLDINELRQKLLYPLLVEV